MAHSPSLGGILSIKQRRAMFSPAHAPQPVDSDDEDDDDLAESVKQLGLRNADDPTKISFQEQSEWLDGLVQTEVEQPVTSRGVVERKDADVRGAPSKPVLPSPRAPYDRLASCETTPRCDGANRDVIAKPIDMELRRGWLDGMIRSTVADDGRVNVAEVDDGYGSNSTSPSRPPTAESAHSNAPYRTDRPAQTNSSKNSVIGMAVRSLDNENVAQSRNSNSIRATICTHNSAAINAVQAKKKDEALLRKRNECATQVSEMRGFCDFRALSMSNGDDDSGCVNGESSENKAAENEQSYSIPTIKDKIRKFANESKVPEQNCVRQNRKSKSSINTSNGTRDLGDALLPPTKGH